MFQSHITCLNCSIKGIDVPKTFVLLAISEYFRRLFNNWDERAFYFGMNYSLLPVKDFFILLLQNFRRHVFEYEIPNNT